jgi:hypothetical protein
VVVETAVEDIWEVVPEQLAHWAMSKSVTYIAQELRVTPTKTNSISLDRTSSSRSQSGRVGPLPAAACGSLPGSLELVLTEPS